MKQIILLTIFLFLIACKKKDSPLKFLNEQFDVSQGTLLKSGKFSSNAHEVSGCVNLYRSGNQIVVFLENFSTEKGPNLRVYLSTSIDITEIKDLGAIKSNTGSFYYSTDSLDTKKYPYVLIWCKDYSVLFGNSKLN